MHSKIRRLRGLGAAAATAVLFAVAAHAQSENASPRAQAVMDYWSPGKRAAAQPRDLYIDHRGLAFSKDKRGAYKAVGHGKKFELEALYPDPAPKAKPDSPGGGGKPGGGGGGGGGGGSSDTTPPTISGAVPPDGSTIGSSQTFSAVVTDASGVKSVTFTVNYTGGTQTFTPTLVGNDTYSVTLQGFPAGAGSWFVTAKDTAKKGGNTATSPTYGFTVETGGGTGGDTVTNAPWNFGGDVLEAAGRIYFEMPGNAARTTWGGYVCSGTVVSDATTGRSVIITAAHCVYDDANKSFARNVLFIPNQDGTTGSGTDLNCSNDPLGCWAPNFGVVDDNWTIRTFPDNIPWDYAYYVVDDTGAHSGTSAGTDVLDSAVPNFSVQFSAPTTGDVAHALGYSYSDDPNFMYCKETMTTEGAYNWWLSQCDLSGGSSGGPWVQPMDEGTGTGPLMSVNSWGYTTSPGMAGPKLSGTSASCLFDTAKSGALFPGSVADGDAGYAPICP